MAIKATIFSTRTTEGKEIEALLIAYLQSLGFVLEINNTPEQTEFFNACISQDLVIVDATVEDGDLHNYAAFTAQPMALDHVLVVSRSYLPQNFFGMREGGAPDYPNRFSNEVLMSWLKKEVEELLAEKAIPRSGWKKNMIGTGLISPFQNIFKDQARKAARNEVFISYRNSCRNRVVQWKHEREALNHSALKDKIAFFEPGVLAYEDEVLSPLQRWGILSIIEEKMRLVRECWIYESTNPENPREDYYNSWWTLGEMIILGALEFQNKSRPVLKVYNPATGAETVEPAGIVPQLTADQKRHIDRLLSGAGRTRGEETAQRMRELQDVPWIGSWPVFNYPTDNVEWYKMRVMESYPKGNLSWKGNIDVDAFLQCVSRPALVPVPNSVLREVAAHGSAKYEFEKIMYDITMKEHPRYAWYATRMGKVNGPEDTGEKTIARLPVFLSRAKS